MLSLLSTQGSVCLEGRDVAVLVPVQADAVDVNKFEFVRICSAGFLLGVGKSPAMSLPPAWCCMVLWVTVELQSGCAWLGCEQAPCPDRSSRGQVSVCSVQPEHDFLQGWVSV